MTMIDSIKWRRGQWPRLGNGNDDASDDMTTAITVVFGKETGDSIEVTEFIQDGEWTQLIVPSMQWELYNNDTDDHTNNENDDDSDSMTVKLVMTTAMLMMMLTFTYTNYSSSYLTMLISTTTY